MLKNDAVAESQQPLASKTRLVGEVGALISSPEDKSTPSKSKSKPAARASRACTTCRKQKTRCFPAPNSLGCLRCKTLALDCSFMHDSDDYNLGLSSWDNGLGPGGASAVQSKLDSVERNVAKILRILGSDSDDYYDDEDDDDDDDENDDGDNGDNAGDDDGGDGNDDGGSGNGRNSNLRKRQRSYGRHSRRRHRGRAGINTHRPRLSLSPDNTTVPQSPSTLNRKYRIKGTSFGHSSFSFNASPFNVFGSLTSEKNLPLPIKLLYNPSIYIQTSNIINQNIVTRDEAIDLLDHFRKHYNHWVSFPEKVPIELLLDRTLTRCSFLVTVCCCVSVRLYNKSLHIRCYNQLLLRLLEELRVSLVLVPQTLEFMQALALLAIYASSLSTDDVIFDAWFYSGMALQHFITKDNLGLALSFDGHPWTEFDEITAYRVWNHLCLVHLVSCVQSGRMCLLDDVRLNMCRRTLELTSATNFDGRMIAEINLQNIVCNFVSSDQSMKSVEKELRRWLEKWKYLFEQPTIQFVEAGYHYGYFTILYYWNYLQSAESITNVHDSLINDIVATAGGDNGTAAAGGAASTSHTVNNTNNKPVSVNAIGNELLCSQTVNSCTDDVLRQMIGHLEKVVESLLSFADDEYFSHLSDQIQFCGSFAGLMIVKIVSILKELNRQKVLTKQEITTCLKKVDQLSMRFGKVAVYQDSLTAKYSASLTAALTSL